MSSTHPIDIDQLAVGQVVAERRVRLTRGDVVAYSGASTDLNPIHWSDRAARAIGLEGVIAHGMWTMGAALSGVLDWAGGPERLEEYFVRFTRPVAVPDTDEGTEVAFTATIAEITPGQVTIALEAVCVDQKVLGAARARVRV